MASAIDKNVEQMKKVESVILSGVDTALSIVDDLSLTASGSNVFPEFAQGKFEELKRIVRHYVNLEDDLKLHLEAIRLLKNEVSNSDDIESIDLDVLLQEKLQSLKQANPSDFSTHPKYKELLEKLEDIQMPPDTQMLPNVMTETVEDPDGDLLMTQSSINTIDPISRQEIRDPVRNRSCKHLYDRTSIMNYIRTRQGRAKCPIPGCGSKAFLKAEELDSDAELKKYIDRKRKQQAK